MAVDMVKHQVFLLLIILTTACSGGGTQIQPTNTPSPNPLETPRWVFYEKALADKILQFGGEGKCEWEIWGVSGQEVYVWAQCNQGLTAGSMPAVIYLGENGRIENVVIPGHGTQYGIDIQTLFPAYLHERILSMEFSNRAKEAEKHISTRTIDHSPPLIVLSGTPLP